MSATPLEMVLKEVPAAQLCAGLVIVIAELLEAKGRVVLTADEESIGPQFVELARYLRGHET